MAGRMRALLEQLERMYRQADALDRELTEMASKYARFRKGLWQEHAEAASQALSDASDHFEILVLMATDLVNQQADGDKSMLPGDDGE